METIIKNQKFNHPGEKTLSPKKKTRYSKSITFKIHANSKNRAIETVP